MTGINFVPTCWNGTLPFVMPHRLKMARLSSAHGDLEEFWGSGRSAAVPCGQWLRVNQQQRDTQLRGQGRITEHCRGLLLEQGWTRRCGGCYGCPKPSGGVGPWEMGFKLNIRLHCNYLPKAQKTWFVLYFKINPTEKGKEKSRKEMHFFFFLICFYKSRNLIIF